MSGLLDQLIADIRSSWRFRWVALVTAWLACMGGWAFVYVMPDEYEAKASILFDATSELNKLLEQMTVNADMLSRVEIVRTILLGRPQLERVAQETGMYRRAKKAEELQALIDGLQERIEIKDGRQRGGNLYEIRYRDPEPEMAFSVVQNLLDTFVNETLGANKRSSEAAQSFLVEELADLEAELTAAEKRLADFKRENVGKMPSEVGDYFARLELEISELEATQSELRQANRRKEALKKQLAGEPVTVDSAEPQSELDRRILENQNRLEELQLRFTDLHPDVIAVKATLEQLRKQKQDQIDAMRESDGMGVASGNPVFQNIQIELSKINVDVASLEEKAAIHQRKIAELQGLVNVLPEIEAELARLNRDYGVTQAQYQSLLQRLEVAELSASAEESGEVKFKIVEPPSTPSSPVAPNRPLLISAVLLFALVGGSGLAFLGSQIKPVFSDARSVRQATGLPILGTVLVVATGEVRQRRYKQVVSFVGALVVLFGLFAVVLVFHDVGSSWIQSSLG